MKRFFLICALCLCANLLNAQITIMDDDVQEKIVSKPRVFDSLSNIMYQKDPIQYKQYIGYKLYCLPVSKKYNCGGKDCTIRLQEFKYKSPREIVLPHKPFAQTDRAKVFGDISKLKGNALAQYQEKEEKYEREFVVSTDIYNATTEDKQLPDMSRDDIKNYVRNKIYTPYESIQKTYFTILNIEIAASIEAKKGLFSALENWDDKYNDVAYLRFTLKNETSGDELYWIHRTDLKYHEMFLVPYFEKMQKTYKGQNVVPTAKMESLADINTGEPVNIQPKEVWQCYEVTFVNLKDKRFIRPCLFLEKDGSRVMIEFDDFTERKWGVLSEEDHIRRPAFILERDYDEIVAERKRTAEEKQRLEEERSRLEEQARVERNKQIMQKYGNKYGKMICEGKVCLNMTKEMCIEAWGEPLYVNSTIVSGLVHEQWVYGWHNYLYFDNGVLKAIQN